MDNLRKALNIWLEAGGSQALFIQETGIKQSMTSAIFRGDRAVKRDMFPKIFHAFERRNLPQALAFLRAHMLDQIPDGLEKNVSINVHGATGETVPATVERKAGEDRLEVAMEWFRSVYRSDPAVAEYLLAGFKMRNPSASRKTKTAKKETPVS